MNSKLIALRKLLKDQNLKEYLFVSTSINKNLEIKGSKNLFNYLEKNDISLNIDFPKGSMKGFGSKKRRLTGSLWSAKKCPSSGKGSCLAWPSWSPHTSETSGQPKRQGCVRRGAQY